MLSIELLSIAQNEKEISIFYVIEPVRGSSDVQ